VKNPGHTGCTALHGAKKWLTNGALLLCNKSKALLDSLSICIRFQKD